MSHSPSQKITPIMESTGSIPAAEKPTMRAVFETEEEGLLRFAFGLLGRREVAEEIVQEGFLALFENYQEVANPRAWLYRAVRNKALNELRKRKREFIDETTGEECDDEREAPDEVLGRMEATGQLRLLMADLTPRDGELVRMKYFEGLDYKEIAKRCEMTVGNVGYRLHHVLKGLADGLRKVGVEGRLG